MIYYLKTPITDKNHPDAQADNAMRDLDEPKRNALIAQADNVIDDREHFERASLDGVPLSMPHPFVVVDLEEDE